MDPGLPLETTGASRCHRCGWHHLFKHRQAERSVLKTPFNHLHVAPAATGRPPEDVPREASPPGLWPGRRPRAETRAVRICLADVHVSHGPARPVWFGPRGRRLHSSPELGDKARPLIRGTRHPVSQGGAHSSGPSARPSPAFTEGVLGLLAPLQLRRPPALRPLLPWAGEGCRGCQWRLPAAGGLEACGGRSPTPPPPAGRVSSWALGSCG